VLQNQLFGHLTRQFFVAAGITKGMNVLDVGSGAGDVAMTLAELVGPQGRVVGVDTNADILETARERVEAAGWSNVEFRHGDVSDIDLGEVHDAVVGRWVLMYVPDPADLLRTLAGRVRPGGIIAFQEGDFRNPLRSYPAVPLHEQVARWTTPPPGAPGPDIEMGPKLFQTYLAAGLPAPHLRVDAAVGGGPDWPGYRYLAGTVRSLLPFLEQIGAVTAAEVDIDTLEERLRDEVVAVDGIQILPSLFGAWTHT
jgi:SAM-dependent methyltransferase